MKIVIKGMEPEPVEVTAGCDDFFSLETNPFCVDADDVNLSGYKIIRVTLCPHKNQITVYVKKEDYRVTRG